MREKFRNYYQLLKSVLKETWKQMQAGQLFTVASSLAYTTILSVIPLLAVSFSIFKAFGGLERLYGIIEPMILSNLAEGASEQAIVTLRRFIENAHAGAVGAGGLIGLVLTSMSMLYSCESAFNRVWNASNARPLFHRIAAYWFFITLGPLAAAFVVGAATSTALPITKLLPSGIGVFLITIILFFAVYKWVPNRKVNWMPALIAAVVTAILWNLARLAYALYNAKVVTYNKIYGSLGAVPIILIWIFIIWLIVLTGAALTAALQKRIDFK